MKHDDFDKHFKTSKTLIKPMENAVSQNASKNLIKPMENA